MQDDGEACFLSLLAMPSLDLPDLCAFVLLCEEYHISASRGPDSVH